MKRIVVVLFLCVLVGAQNSLDEALRLDVSTLTCGDQLKTTVDKLNGWLKLISRSPASIGKDREVLVTVRSKILEVRPVLHTLAQGN
jgi:hypothetical protein